MIIGGLEKLTLVLPRKGEDEKNKKEKGLSAISTEDLFLFLRERFGRLDGVVITGGEPTLHNDLPSFIKKIKKLGYDVKLDTNGTNPEMLAALIKDKLIDYVAMDLKAPFEKYEETIGVKTNCNNLKKSVKIITKSGLPHEFRTTVVPGLLVGDDFEKMGKIIKGADKWYLQKFKSDTGLVNRLYMGKKSYTDKEMKEFASLGRQFVKFCEVRT